MRFHSIKDITNFLHKELEIPNRFPAIFVFFERLSSFKEFLDFIKIKARLLNLANFCAGRDLIPLIDIKRIQNYLSQEKTPLCLLPFCAWWRLNLGYPSAQTLLKELAVFEGKNYPRLIVPLFDPEGQIFSVLAELSRFRSGEGALFLKLEEVQEPYKLYVSLPIPDFKPLGFYIFDGIKNFLAYFSHPSPEEKTFWLFTQAARNIKHGPFLKVFSKPKEIVKELFLDLSIPVQLDDEDFWKELLVQASIFKTNDLDIILQKVFGVPKLETLFLLENWKEFDEFEKKLAILWAANQNKKDIWTEVLANSTPGELVENIYFGDYSLNQLTKRKAILQSLSPYPLRQEKLPQNFWSRLKILTDISREERGQILKLVSEFLKDLDSVPDDILDILGINFPILAFYLTPEDSDPGRYFTHYRLSKLAQKSPSCPSLILERFLPREEAIARSGVPPKQQIWIDGLGGEWIEVLKFLLERTGISCDVSLVRASLPTITETNRPPEGALFWRELDEVGHKYRADPLETILLEFEEIEKIVSRLQEKFYQGNCLLITGDHGLSWSLFHQQKVPLPQGAAEPHRAGRVARIFNLNKVSLSHELWKIDREDKYLCLTTHGYFEGSKRPPQREFHGGALPEEVLVPLIKISQKSEADFLFRLVNPKVRLDPEGKVTIELEIDPHPKGKVYLFITEKKIPTQRKAKKFVAEIMGLEAGIYEVRVFLGNKSLGTAKIEVLPPAIIEDDLGF